MIQICDHKLLIFNLLLIMSVLACEMKEILTFTAYDRGKVEILCPYESRYETHKKYLCRGECKVLKDKDIPVESGSPAKDKRFSLTDNRTTHSFTVTITDLRTEDQGQYWCAVKAVYLQLDVYSEIFLKIKPVSVVSGVTGEHLNITCNYKSDLKNKLKFICKGSDPSLCETSAVKVSSETNISGRFSLRDDEPAGAFTVTITDLTLEDSGIYWCGAGERGQENKNKWISVTDLNIYDVTSERTSPKPATASDHTSKPEIRDTASIRPVTSVLPLSSSTASPSVRSPSSNNASKPQSGFTAVIMSLVMEILAVFGFSLFIYFRLRQKRKGVQLKSVVPVSTENLLTEETTHTVCHYEEIISTNNPAGYSSGRPVFASDTLIYSTVIFQTTDH